MKKVFATYFIFSLCLLVSFASYAENDKEEISDADEKKDKKITIVPLPIIGVNPTTGFLGGFSPGFYYTLGDPSTTSMSSPVSFIRFFVELLGAVGDQGFEGIAADGNYIWMFADLI